MRPASRLHAAAALVLALVLLAACSSARSASPPPVATVRIHNAQFEPSRVDVKAGQSVRWRFDDGAVIHDVTAVDQRFSSGKRVTGEFTQRFTKPGTYAYVCTVHFGMEGIVLVG
jgi:plastocyanin